MVVQLRISTNHVKSPHVKRSRPMLWPWQRLARVHLVLQASCKKHPPCHWRTKRRNSKWYKGSFPLDLLKNRHLNSQRYHMFFFPSGCPTAIQSSTKHMLAESIWPFFARVLQEWTDIIFITSCFTIMFHAIWPEKGFGKLYIQYK